MRGGSPTSPSGYDRNGVKGFSQYAPPPIKESPTAPDDGFDAQRVQYVLDCWNQQTPALQSLHRTIEENIRMLSGRQWDVWSELLGTFVDVAQYMTDEERRWRQRPVVNLLQYWFMLTHARLTESPPAITFHPATQDRMDVQLAEALEPVYRTLWDATNMDDVFVRLVAWLIAAGEVYLETAVDFTRGDRRELTGPAVLSMQGTDGQVIQRATQGPVPYDASGTPQASLTADGSGYDVPDGAEPYSDHEGCLCPRVRSPLEVRSEWGAEIAWTDKRWIATESFVLPEQVWDQYQVECEADSAGDGTEGFLQRILFGSGYFGAVNNRLTSSYGSQTMRRYCRVWTYWEKPSGYSPETDDSPGGRLLVVTKDHVLHDSARPYRTHAAGPIRRAQFIQQPGRGGFGSTPLEQMVPVQKTYNRGWAQILEHRNLSTNPILIYDENQGIEGEFTNLPGSKIGVDMSISTQPAYYLQPPPLSADVWKVQAMLLDILMRLGSMAGAEGQAPTDDPSGALISQLRYNSDRPVSIAARSMAYLITDMADDWRVILPTIWTTEKTLSYMGDDKLFQTITLTPDLWDGDVRVRPDLTNARLETPEVKKQAALAYFTAGVFGPPGTPSATQGMARYTDEPNLNKLLDAGGPDADMVRMLMSQLAQGQLAPQAIQWEEWYDYGVWLKVVREHVASPEFKKHPEPVQQNFRLFYALIQHAGQAQALTQMQRQAPLAARVAATQGGIARIAQAAGPQPPADSPNGSSPPPPSGDTPSPDASAA